MIARTRINHQLGLSQFAWNTETHVDETAAADNLAEALAYYYSYKFAKNDSKFEGEIDAQMRKRLLEPNSKDFAFVEHFNCGSRAFREEKYFFAMREFRLASEVDPANPTPFTRIFASKFKLKDYAGAKDFSFTATKLLNNSNVPDYEYERSMLLSTEALFLVAEKKYQQAFEKTSSVVNSNPENKAGLLIRANINLLLKRYGLAAVDAYSAESKQWVFNCGSVDALTPEEIFKMFDSSVQQHSERLGQILRRRARFCEALGDKESNKSKRNQMYENAINNLIESMEYRDCRLVDALFDCAQLSIKLESLDQARDYRDSLRQLEPNSLAANVIDVQLLELSHQSKEAKSLMDKITPQLFKGSLRKSSTASDNHSCS